MTGVIVTVEEISSPVNVVVEEISSPVNVTATTTENVVNVMVGSGSVPVTNSDGSFTDTAVSPLYTIPDTTYNFYVGSNPVVTTTIPSVKDETFNLNWT